MKFFINYVEIYSDNGLTDINDINYKDNFDNIKWKKYTHSLNAGFYSFLFQYTKSISLKLGNFLALKIKYIETDGIDSSSHECFPFIKGFTRKEAPIVNYVKTIHILILLIKLVIDVLKDKYI